MVNQSSDGDGRSTEWDEYDRADEQVFFNVSGMVLLPAALILLLPPPPPTTTTTTTTTII